MSDKIELKKTTVEKLQSDKNGQVIYWDKKLTGFGLRVSPGGSKTYFLQGRLNGRVKKVTIGRHGVITAETARKEAKRMQSMMELGQDPTPPKPEKSTGRTFGDLLEGYIDLLNQQGKGSARSVETALHKNVKTALPKLWKKPAKDITLDDCMLIIGKLKDKGLLRQADKVRSYIRTAFSEAINARGDVNMPASMRRLNIVYNPARDLRKVKGASKAKDRALSLAEFRAYWKRIKKLPEPKKSIAMIHVLTGGQRQQQLARATMADIDRDSATLTLWDGKGRRSEPRRHVVPLLPDVIEAIERIGGGGEYAVSCNGGQAPISIDYINSITKAICTAMQEAGELEGAPFTAGAIRATIETRLIAKPYRVSSDVLGYLLSHGMGGVQQRHYQHHHFDEEKREALEMLQRMVEGKSEPVAEVIEMRARA